MPKRLRKNLIHLGLFLLTVFTTLIVGAELTIGKPFFGYGLVEADLLLSWKDLNHGISYSFAFLAFLTVHEFGHYFTAMYHRVKASLPYYIPIYIPFVLNIGSLGAVIRLMQTPDSTRKFFDIGIAGPLAGFVVSVMLLGYGFTHLPDPEEYILGIHPEYVEYFGGVPTPEEQDHFWKNKMRFFSLTEEEQAQWLSEEERAAQLSPEEKKELALQAYQDPAIKVGSNLLYEAMKSWLVTDSSRVPDHYEMIHYPWLFVGYLTLFFTALNLLPIGQLDGGHVIYGMFGRKAHGYVSRITVGALILIGGTGVMDLAHFGDTYLAIGIYALYLTFIFNRILPRSNNLKVLIAMGLTLAIQAAVKWWAPEIQVSIIWLLYAFVAVRFLGIDHPPALREHRVNLPRLLLGGFAMLIFLVCFTPNPVLVV